MSPIIHSAGFKYYNLPHTYEIYQTKTVEELRGFIGSPAFGGASVTMPHKLAIKMYCSKVSKHAEIIGAVNTLIREEGHIVGENTDWIGLASLLNGRAHPNGVWTGYCAGGASRAALYALYKAGVKKIYLWNRTKSRAEEIAQNLKPFFEIVVLDQLADISSGEAPQVTISTIPVDKTDVGLFPPILFQQPEGICIDMAYKPRLTPLIVATRRFASEAWSTITGLEVLLQQGFMQFELWTKKKAPEREMRQALCEWDTAVELRAKV